MIMHLGKDSARNQLGKGSGIVRVDGIGIIVSAVHAIRSLKHASSEFPSLTRVASVPTSSIVVIIIAVVVIALAECQGLCAAGRVPGKEGLHDRCRKGSEMTGGVTFCCGRVDQVEEEDDEVEVEEDDDDDARAQQQQWMGRARGERQSKVNL